MKKAIILITVLLNIYIASGQITIGNRNAPLTVNQDVNVFAGSTLNSANITAEGRTVTLSGSTTLIKSTICCYELILNAGTLTLGKDTHIYCNSLTIGGGFTSIAVDGDAEINCNQIQLAPGLSLITVTQGVGAKQPKLSIYYTTGNLPQFTATTANMTPLTLLTKSFTGCQ